MKFKKIRYNFSDKLKLHKLCSNEGYTHILEYIFFDEGNAIASDGHEIVVVPVRLISNLDPEHINKLNGHLIHSSVFKKLICMDFIEDITDTHITAISDDGFTIRTTFPIEVNGSEGGNTYVNYKSVFEQAIEDNKKNEEKEVSFNSERLNELCKVFHQNQPIITPNGEYGGINIRFKGECEEIKALIMPCSFKNNSYD